MAKIATALFIVLLVAPTAFTGGVALAQQPQQSQTEVAQTVPPSDAGKTALPEASRTTLQDQAGTTWEGTWRHTSGRTGEGFLTIQKIEGDTVSGTVRTTNGSSFLKTDQPFSGKIDSPTSFSFVVAGSVTFNLELKKPDLLAGRAVSTGTSDFTFSKASPK